MEAPRSTHQDTPIEMAAAAPAVGKGKRKRAFSDDDLYLLLHRCTPTTILTALQEVAQHAGRRNIDWRALVAKTATGITSAREYQMLWRHFAYRHDLADNVDASAQPLGDESDLECEIESVPTPSNEALAEASDFAKILLSGSSRKQASSHHVNSEAPLQRTPNKKIPRVPSDKQLAPSHRLTNGTGPVSSSKQASHTGLSPDPFDGNGPHNKKKKPKPWIKEEELTAGVYKCGEVNLHNCNFDNARTPLQLSQGRAMICKRQGTTKPANAKSVSVNFDIKATQKACSMAVDMPTKKLGLSTLRSGASQSSIQHPSQLVFGGATVPEAKSATASSSLPVPVQLQPPLAQVQQAPAQAAALKASNTSNKSRNPTSAPSSMQALATAAGGRIATPSVAASLIKATQSTKALHVKPRGVGSSETSTSSKTPAIPGQPGTAQVGSAQHPAEPSGAPTLSPMVLTAQATSEQVRVASERVAGVNIPPEQSAFRVVTMEDLFPEDAKQPETVVEPRDAHMLGLKKGCLDESEAVQSAPEAQGSQKEQPKMSSAVGRSIPLFAGKKTESTPGASPPAGASSGLVGTGIAGVLSKAVWGKARQNRCRQITGQKLHHRPDGTPARPTNVVPSTTGAAARNVVPSTPVVNGAIARGIHRPANSQAN